jgi:RNA polymerase sigma factor (sigma-70 family)
MGNLELAEQGWPQGGRGEPKPNSGGEPARADFVAAGPVVDTFGAAEKAVTFHELYERYAADVYRFAFWLTANAEDARDITSQTFVNVWIADVEPRAETVKAYLFTIARNLHRKQWRRASRHESIADDMIVIDPAARPDAATADKEELARAMTAIGELPELDRTVLLLRVQDGLPYDEIAAITGISAAAAKVKVFRARARLAARLHPQF